MAGGYGTHIPPSPGPGTSASLREGLSGCNTLGVLCRSPGFQAVCRNEVVGGGISRHCLQVSLVVRCVGSYIHTLSKRMKTLGSPIVCKIMLLGMHSMYV